MLVCNWCRRYISTRTVGLQGRIVQSLLVQNGSTVLAQVGLYVYQREACQFKQQYNVSGRSRYLQVNWHRAYQFMWQQYGTSNGLYSLNNLGIGYGYLWRQQYNASDRFKRLRIIQVLDTKSFGSRFRWWQYSISDGVVSQAYQHEAYQFR